MNPNLIRNIGIILFLGLLWLCYSAVQDYNGMTEEQQTDGIIRLIAYFLLTAVVGGFLFVSYILPMFGDAVGEAMLSSAEEAGTDPYLKARGKVAIGDYEGAVALFREIAKENPGDRMPIADIVKLYLERLHDPANAELTLENAIREEHWEEEDAAWFIFRLVDLIQEHQPDDQDRLVNLLQKCMRRYPETRHYANAVHRLREIDPELVKSVQAEIAADQSGEGEGEAGAQELDSGIPSPSTPPPSGAQPPKPNV
ncbi:MAG: hypothetical protein L7V86_21015 [Verrucomicrobiales bacterium]|nr:hypothetical protein [Verrucomicrobiales bacterium]